jgi:hypothetical protein
MRLSVAALILFLASAGAFAPPPSARRTLSSSRFVLSEDVDVLTLDAIGGMSFRELQHACRENGLSPEGTTGALRARIRQVICPVDPFTGEEDCPVPEVSHTVFEREYT